MTRVWSLASVVIGAALLSGCPPPRTCGEGTELVDGSCVAVEAPDVECGPGTTNDNGTCVTSDVDCGPGTELVDGQCVPSDGPRPTTCGPGTENVDGVCVPLTPDDVCGPGTVLRNGSCVIDDDGGACTPDCLGKECGDDGCGGTCGSCSDPAFPTCDTHTGQCVAVCVPQCAGKTCGDDGCGGTCGTCDANASCNDGLGKCVPDAWTCSASYYAGGDICDCDCGAYDPDCDLGAPLAGCEEQERCNSDGECVPRAPAEWTCSPLSYAANNTCDCNCGVYDPDCDFVDLVGITGCGAGVSECFSDGTCGTCTPDCTDKDCGTDGCGGFCGFCNVDVDAGVSELCIDGSCVDECGDPPAVCLVAECGDDGCGGTCGTCASGSSCEDGVCLRDPVMQTPFSCAGRCESVAPSGCYCTEACVALGNCCSDFAEHCQCVPNCDGKVCGSDGCGGSCGDCDAAAPFCTDDGQCTDQCTPTCGNRQCGPDGCGGSCGTCGDDESCYWTYQCIPDNWTCDGVLYGDEQGCDCGCGAVDPDCEAEDDPFVYGCPFEAQVCADTGICDITFCHDNDECGGQWCTGAYAEGDFTFGGFCAEPIQEGDPPGSICGIHEECASLLCAGDQCRQHCESDLACPGDSICVGIPIKDIGTRLVQGYAGVCDLVAGSATPCNAQTDCPGGERCIAVMDPVSGTPRTVCSALLDVNADGQPCDFDDCPAGYRCEETDNGAVCALPCPGGASDCLSGFACTERPFAPLLDNGATVPLCLPE